MTPPPAAVSPWPFRFSFAALLCAVPLFLFGGTVTTIGAGMAVQGWWDAEGHFMPFFPVDLWLRDFGTFVEHTHRLWGMAVGFFALAAVAATFVLERRAAARIAASLALLAVIAQGALGGLRVLENSPELAFLHGVFGQGVFAVLAASTLLLSARWRGAERASADVGLGGLRAQAWGLAALVYAQIAIGCWYRHGLRNLVGDGIAGRLHLHIAVAVVVLVGVIVVAGRSGRAGARAGGAAGARLRGLRLRLHALVGAQIVLGLLAWWAYAEPAPGDPKTHGEFEITLSVLHVLGGALLLAQTVAAALWAGRLAAPRAAGSTAAASAA